MMEEPIGPLVMRIGSVVRDVVDHGDGGLAVLTAAGIDLLDGALRHVGAFTGDAIRGDRLQTTDDGRFLVHGARGPMLVYESVPDRRLVQVAGDTMWWGVQTISNGFVLTSRKQALFDRGGERRRVDLPLGGSNGVTRWRDGVALAGHEGLTILGATGEIVATAEAFLSRAPVALRDAIAVPGSNEIVLFDGSGRVVASIPTASGVETPCPFESGMLVRPSEDALSYIELRGGEIATLWTWRSPARVQSPVVVGSHIVVRSWDREAWVLDASGSEVAAWKLEGTPREIVRLAKGVVVRVQGSADLLWWRDLGSAPVRLSHDVEASIARTVKGGVTSAEADVLYLWHPGASATDPGPPDVGGIPIGERIVSDGLLLTAESAGRFAYRGRTPNGRVVRVPKDATWRRALTRGEALDVLDALVRRDLGGELPEWLNDRSDDLHRRLCQLSPTRAVSLHARAMFAPEMLDDRQRDLASSCEEAFFGELGSALERSGRVIRACALAGRPALEPPRPIPGFEYLGTFACTGELGVGDPCHAKRDVSSTSDEPISFTTRVSARAGPWHVFVRPVEEGRIGELALMHSDGGDVEASVELDRIAVDSGMAGVFDRTCPASALESPSLMAGPIAGLGALSTTGYGDGVYPAFVDRASGPVSKIRLVFVGDESQNHRNEAAEDERPRGNP